MDNSKRQKCLVYSRVNGWYVPTIKMNKGKIEEYKDRKVYEIKHKEDEE